MAGRDIGWRVCEGVHGVALAVWLGGLVMSGAIAAQLFPLVRAMDPVAPGYERYEGDQWLIVAGRIGDMVFATGDVVQFLCACVALLTLVASVAIFRLSARRISTLVRAIALGAGVILVAYQIFALGPAMQEDLRAYWRAASAGDNDLAGVHRDRFSLRHPEASRVLGLTALAVLVGVVGSVWSVAGGRDVGSSAEA